jgi:hypothetical protein
VIRGALFAFTVALATLSASAVRLSQARALVPVTGVVIVAQATRAASREQMRLPVDSLSELPTDADPQQPSVLANESANGGVAARRQG